METHPRTLQEKAAEKQRRNNKNGQRRKRYKFSKRQSEDSTLTFIKKGWKLEDNGMPPSKHEK